MNLTLFNVLALSSAGSDFLLCVVSSHNSYPSLLLLICDGAFRTLTGTSVGLAALAANGQAATMTQAAVAADLSQALDVKCHTAAKVALNDEVVVDALTQLCFFLFGEVLLHGCRDLYRSLPVFCLRWFCRYRRHK